MTTLTNSFHNTEFKTRKTAAQLDFIRYTHPANRTAGEKAFVARARRKLCGVTGCTCGGEFGER